MGDYATIEVEPLTPRIGALIHGLDLREPLTDQQRADVATALARHLVIFWRDQDLTDDQHLAFAATFGAVNRSAYAPPDAVGPDAVLEWIEDGPDSPPKADLWHTDLAFLPEPPDVAVLSLLHAPAVGGDTLWVDLYGAYEALSPAMQEAIAGLELELRPAAGTLMSGGDRQWIAYRPDPTRRGGRQPLTRVHPVTGRRALFLCGQFVEGIAGMTEEEGEMVLAVVRSTLDDPNLQCRWRWRQGDVVVWDERCTNHRATSDHFPHRRLIRRCTAGAAAPVAGPARYSSAAGSTPVPPAALLA